MGKTSQPVQTPGGDAPASTAPDTAGAATPELSAPTIVAPEAPHGAAAYEASKHKHLTSTELVAEIDAGRVKEPLTGVLCADGWYAPRR